MNALGFWPMEARPVKTGKARLDLLKLAAAKLNDYLRETSNASNDASPSDGAAVVSLPSGFEAASKPNAERMTRGVD